MTELMGSQEKNFFAGLVDFGFRQQQVRRLAKILYVIAVLGGFVAQIGSEVYDASVAGKINKFRESLG